MGSRPNLQIILEELLGNRNVYYQPPDNVRMSYPAIRYKKSKIEGHHADDKRYKNMTRYELIVIDRTPDNPVINKLLELPYCSYDRWYAANNLNHDVLTLYY
jgi:hypothetical protein